MLAQGTIQRATGAAIHLDIPHMLIGTCVDDRKGPGFRVADSNVKVFGFGVVSSVASVPIDRLSTSLNVSPAKTLQVPSVPLATNSFEIRRIEYALRLALPRNARCSRVGFEIDDLYGVWSVTQRGDKETFARGVHSKMIQSVRPR